MTGEYTLPRRRPPVAFLMMVASLIVSARVDAQPANASATELVAREAGADGAAAAPGEGGNWMKRFVVDVGGDYKNFLSLETAGILAVGGAAAGGVHAGDETIAEHARESNTTLKGGETYGSQYLHIPVALGTWMIGAAAGSSGLAEVGRDLLRAQISVVSWTYAIKLASNRTRPNGDPRSFPSGHASTSFATAAVLQEHFGWMAGLPAYAVAAYTGVSRVTANQHWASDVVFGAAVGMASGRTVTLHLRTTKVSVVPTAIPGGAVVTVVASRQP
jgi:hypothetical protein